MKVDEIRDLLRTKPFRPFFIHLPEGRRVRVFHPDFALISPGGRTMVAYEDDDHFNIIDIMLISSIEMDKPNGKSRPKSRPRNLDA